MYLVYDESMNRPQWTYMLRLPKRSQSRFPMDRLGEYIREFAELLGTDNSPVFKGIRNASIGIRASVPDHRSNNASARIVQAKTEPNSRAGRVFSSIETMLGRDGIPVAELLDSAGKVVCLFRGAAQEQNVAPKVFQEGMIDGVVTGLVGADDTMHLHLRDRFDRDLRLVIREEHLARELLQCFRTGHVRLDVRGTWVQTDEGWIPESGKCLVTQFVVLDESPLSEVLEEFVAIPDNGWKTIEAPLEFLASLRGVQ